METPQKSSQKPAQKQTSIGLDINLYQDMLDCPDIDHTQKQNLIEALWAIALDFVDMGFGIHPVQLALEERAQSKT